MLVYLAMRDETIERVLYRTGAADRSFALGLAGLLGVCLPLFGWAAGPFLKPWGLVALGMMALGMVGEGVWWWRSLATVVWLAQDGGLQFAGGRKGLILAFDELTRVVVRPSEITTWLEAGDRSVKISHRLVGFEDFLDRLRQRRPDLFPPPEVVARFRVSQVGTTATLLLALATTGVGLLIFPWQPGVGVIFFGGALLAVGHAFFFSPRSFVVGPGSLTEVFWFRKKTSRGVISQQESFHAASGAVFFRMRFNFGKRKVVLDEGSLLDPLRPWAEWVVDQLGRS